MNKLNWFVLNYDVNSNKVKPYNVLSNWESSIRKARKKMKTKNDLISWLNKEFMYYYWCKAEYETMMGGFSTDVDDLEKIDIYTQLKPNLEVIADYIIHTLNFKGLK